MTKKNKQLLELGNRLIRVSDIRELTRDYYDGVRRPFSGYINKYVITVGYALSRSNYDNYTLAYDKEANRDKKYNELVKLWEQSL